MAKLIIKPGLAEQHYWADLWRYRELFYFLAWRDLLVRYKQTVIGVAWTVLRPLLALIVFSFVFGRLAKLPSGNVPYPLFVFAALLPWQFFANALTESGNSLIQNGNLISKVYFPRLIVPAGAVIVSLVDFVVSCIILAGLFAWYRYLPGWEMLVTPAFVALAFCAALGPGLLVTALNVQYRDFRYVVPFVVQMGLYLSPVGFSSAIIPGDWRLVYSLNPMVGVIDGFRWAICGTELYVPGLVVSILVNLALLVGGIVHFRRMERRFADLM
jgi:lipopolysaccharide transport system permease protein